MTNDLDQPKSNQSKTASTEDETLWAYATKDVSPLDKKSATKSIKAQPKKAESVKSPPQNHSHPIVKKDYSRKNVHSHPPQIDTRTAQKLSRGQFKIDMRIDLHGMSRNQAYDKLQEAIPRAYTSGMRCILLITGKGGQKSGNIPLHQQSIGVLKKMTPQWLQEPPLSQYVLRFETAKPKDGGAGALYVLLKRQR